MDEPRRSLKAAQTERCLLAALCAPSLDPHVRAEIFEGLAAHAFSNPDHEVIFQALAKMPCLAGGHIRETLPARLTNMGFPDIDLGPILELPPPSTARIRTLLHQLNR